LYNANEYSLPRSYRERIKTDDDYEREKEEQQKIAEKQKQEKPVMNEKKNSTKVECIDKRKMPGINE
jgi:hypothetical protein